MLQNQGAENSGVSHRGLKIHERVNAMLDWKSDFFLIIKLREFPILPLLLLDSEIGLAPGPKGVETRRLARWRWVVRSESRKN
jgi:hypothetical protein